MISLPRVGTLPCLQDLSQVKSSHFLFNSHKYVYMVVKNLKVFVEKKKTYSLTTCTLNTFFL